jgi:hypothetical protein
LAFSGKAGAIGVIDLLEQKAEGRGQKEEGKGQRAEGRRRKGKDGSRLL